MILVGIVVAEKFFNDKHLTNSEFAKLGGVKLKELNRLEANFLTVIDFKLAVTKEDYETYYRKIIVLSNKLNSV